jgi:hypothetical protein
MLPSFPTRIGRYRQISQHNEETNAARLWATADDQNQSVPTVRGGIVAIKRYKELSRDGLRRDMFQFGPIVRCSFVT